MSFRRSKTGFRSISAGRRLQPRYNTNDSDIDSPPRLDSLPNVLPELTKIVRKLLPQELPLNVHVRNVDYIENGCEQLSGTLYMTIFRLIFAPDNEIRNNSLITSGNKYISEYDIPLTSIYKINVAPVDSHSGFKSFLNENQIQSETRTFTIITRDFRNITFSKCSVIKSNSIGNKQPLSASKMETYINALRVHCRFQDKEQLYPYLTLQQTPINSFSPRVQRGPTLSSLMSSSGGRSMEDDIADFSMSNDERIKSYLTYQDWIDELYDANEKQWIVDRNKFDKSCVVQTEGPFVRLSHPINADDYKDLIWHWTHISEVRINRRHEQMPYMLITTPGIGEITVAGDALRRTTTDPGLAYSCHYIYEQPFQRYNLAKFPANLKRLQASYEKLIEICVTPPEEDDEKWLAKLNTCKWLKYVSKALHGAVSLAKLLNYKNIQLAGSDKDNSCLMSSLIQILLRPKCRTIKGFCELIVREWLIRGHPFRERFGQVLSDIDGYTAQESPVFLLFLDCIHQLIQQNPFSFEFTDYFLIELYHDVCYCYQHTFAFNSVLERLYAIHNCPKNLLFLSSFDFSLYLHPNTYRLLRNNASMFTVQKSYSFLQQSKRNTPSRRSPNPTKYRLEAPTSTFDTSSTTTNESLPLNSDQFEFEAIESPQTFIGDLQIDWRVFNTVLWSKCYCRYDQNYLPALREQQLSFEITCLEEDLKNVRTKPRRHMTIDTSHSINHANSWHPQMLETRV